MKPEKDFNTNENQVVSMEVQNETPQEDKGKKTATLGIAAALGAALGVSGAAAASTLLHKETPTPPVITKNDLEPEHPIQSQPEVHHHYHTQKTVVVPIEEEKPEPEVKVTSYEMITDEDGNRMDVANITIDGHIGQVFDGDSDGYGDILWIDYNDDGAMQRVELTNLEENNALISMSQLREEADVVIDKRDDYLINEDITIVDNNDVNGLVEPDNDDLIVENHTDDDLPDYTEDNLLADNTSGYEDLGPDYTNDADVSGFIA